MFKELLDTIKNLNSDVKTVANCEKAKKLRKKLLTIGIPMAVLGFIGGLICFALVWALSFDSVTDSDMKMLIIPMIAMFPCLIIGGIGMMITTLGLKIIVTGYATNLIDEAVGNNCPYCGDKIEEGEIFCSQCGKPMRKKCSKCGHINNVKNNFCENCGQNLNE